MANDWRCELPLRDCADLDDAELGLRGEDVRIVAEPGRLAGDYRTMRVSRVERRPRGAWVFGEVEGRTLVAWTDDDGPSAGQTVDVMLNWSQALLFDRATGRVLSAPAG